jgi:hypothetical protein
VVVAAGGDWTSDAPRVLARGSADPQGRFRLVLDDEPSSHDRPTLWVIRPGLLVARRPIDRDATAGPVAIQLEALAKNPIEVTGPDGRPVANARVRPTTLLADPLAIPRPIADVASGTTGPDGRVELSSFRPEELTGVEVEANGFGTQPRAFRGPDGLADLGTKAVVLLPAGRVTGRVQADDPEAAKGLTVEVTSSVGGRGGLDVGSAEVVTDEAGRFEIPAIAAGHLLVRARPRPDSPDLPGRPIRRRLEAGKSIDLGLTLKRGVKVFGMVVEEDGGWPVAGAVSPVEPVAVRTDAEGRYEAFVPPGLVSTRLLGVPRPYVGLPAFFGPRPVVVPPAIAGFELPRIEVERGAEVRGWVVNEDERPVAGAKVVASWTLFDGRTRAPMTASTMTRVDGSFLIGPLDPDASVQLEASSEGFSTPEPVTTRPSEGRPARVAVAAADDQAPVGRVVDEAGQPVVGASVRIWATAGPAEGASLVAFDGRGELRTDAEGRFRGPKRLGPARQYRALAVLDGRIPARTRAVQGDGTGTLTFPDLVLRREHRRIPVEGRVVDRRGEPVSGARVRASGEVVTSDGVASGPDGRFRIEAVADSEGFLFVQHAGHRFLGRAIEPARGPFELTLTRLDEPPGPALQARTLPPDGLALARQLLQPYADRVWNQGDAATRIRVLERLASLDPDQVRTLLDQGEIGDLDLADHLRHAVSTALAKRLEEATPVVEAIRDPEWRSLARLEQVDARPDRPLGTRLDDVDRALQDARTIRDPSRRVVAQARVACRWVELGRSDRARRLLRTLRPMAEELACGTLGACARSEVVSCLSRVEPLEALALAEDLIDPATYDHCRLEIALALAGRDAVAGARLVEELRDARSLARALPRLCHAYALDAPEAARRWVARVERDDPGLAAYAVGMMGLGTLPRDRAGALGLLTEAFDRLERLASVGTTPPGSIRDPASIAAALLPAVERVDPSRLAEFFWRAVSFPGPRTGPRVRLDAERVLFLARYDRDVAETLFEPLLAKASSVAEADFPPFLAAARVLDPKLGPRIVAELPDAPDTSFTQPKNEATLILAGLLARPSPACWTAAVADLLELWTPEAPGAP